MLRSMTGFGRFLCQEEDWSQDWEIRSVNGRYLDIKWKLPASARALEGRFEQIVRKHASRGRITITLNLQVARADLLGMHFNAAMGEAMTRQLETFAVKMGYSYKPDFSRMLNLGFLWHDESKEPDHALTHSLEQGLASALEDWNESRIKEGEGTRKDIATRLIRLEEWLAQLKERSPQVKEERFIALESRIQQVMDRYGLDLNQDRLLQEVAFLSDKLDVSEELARLGIHLQRVGEVLSKGAEAGKRLDFLLQECFREVNTCGNKAQDTQIAGIVVDFKTELEKCREQVQNIE